MIGYGCEGRAGLERHTTEAAPIAKIVEMFLYVKIDLRYDVRKLLKNFNLNRQRWRWNAKVIGEEKWGKAETAP